MKTRASQREDRPTRRPWQGIRARITLQLLVAASIPILVLSGSALVTIGNVLGGIDQELSAAYDATEAVVGETLTDTALRSANDIDGFLIGQIENLQMWAQFPLLVTAAQRGARDANTLGLPTMAANDVEVLMQGQQLSHDFSLTEYLTRLVEISPYSELFFTEANGFVVSMSGPTSDFIQSDEEWWQVAWENGLYISHSEYDESAGMFVITVALRIDEPDTGEPLGVIKGTLDISALQQLADTQAALLEGGEVMIVEIDEATILADTSSGHDPALLLSEAGRERIAAYEPARLASALEPGGAGYVIAGDRLAGYARAQGQMSDSGEGVYPQHSWAVIVSQPLAEVFAVVNQLADIGSNVVAQQRGAGTLFLVVAFALLAGGLALANWQTRVIVRPVMNLQQVTQRLRQGDLAARAAVTTADEFGDLAEHFNSMADDLVNMMAAERAGKTALEERVAAYSAFVHRVSTGELSA
ncbi:MAG: HAMP domain-containing protein, partial [Anaerolineae bacterium]|nr:HAMP domain-containing protein [Anaerolineae bacterium]